MSDTILSRTIASMIELNQLDRVQFTPSQGVVVALGVFDGVHRAHQAIISECVRVAKNRGGIPAVFTFRNHPSEILSPSERSLLLTPHVIKREILASLGVDRLIAPDFDRSLAQMPPQQFIEDVLGRRLAARVVLAGFNFRFGRKGEGDATMLLSYQGGLFDEVRILPRFEHEGVPLSSTRIREAILRGDLGAAESMLGRRYRLAGKVVAGDRRGRLLGYPTANLGVVSQPIPPEGIYGARVHFDPTSTVGTNGLVYIGSAPTFQRQATESPVRIEVFLMDWQGDLYGQWIFVEVMCYIRGDVIFDNPSDLVTQIHKDRDFFQKWLNQHPDM
jgi:riboflavin kinase/FMN adenylyltransferase